MASLLAQVVKNAPANEGDAKDAGFIPGLRRSPEEGNGNTPVFFPGKFHGQKSLVGYSPWGCKESDMTECSMHTCARAHIHTHTHTHTHTHMRVCMHTRQQKKITLATLRKKVKGSMSKDKKSRSKSIVQARYYNGFAWRHSSEERKSTDLRDVLKINQQVLR